MRRMRFPPSRPGPRVRRRVPRAQLGVVGGEDGTLPRVPLLPQQGGGEVEGVEGAQRGGEGLGGPAEDARRKPDDLERLEEAEDGAPPHRERFGGEAPTEVSRSSVRRHSTSARAEVCPGSRSASRSAPGSPSMHRSNTDESTYVLTGARAARRGGRRRSRPAW